MHRVWHRFLAPSLAALAAQETRLSDVLPTELAECAEEPSAWLESNLEVVHSSQLRDFGVFAGAPGNAMVCDGEILRGTLRF